MKVPGIARGEIVAHLRTGENTPMRYDVTARVRDGRFAHKMLPSPLERIKADVRCTDGRVSVATLEAHSGPTRLDVRLAEGA